MKTWQRTFTGTTCIAAVVIAGAWHANDPEMHGWPLSVLTSGSTSTAPLPAFCITEVGWSADGGELLSLSRGGRDNSPHLALHDINHKSTHLTIDALDDWVSSAVLAPDGRHVLVGSNQGRLLWLATDTSATPLPLVEPSIAPAFFTATAMASDGRQVAGGTNIGTIFAGDLELKTAFTLTASQTSSIVAVCFSNDDKRLLMLRPMVISVSGSWRRESGCRNSWDQQDHLRPSRFLPTETASSRGASMTLSGSGTLSPGASCGAVNLACSASQPWRCQPMARPPPGQVLAAESSSGMSCRGRRNRIS